MTWMSFTNLKRRERNCQLPQDLSFLGSHPGPGAWEFSDPVGSPQEANNNLNFWNHLFSFRTQKLSLSMSPTFKEWDFVDCCSE